jgi:hypothetical protein
VAPSTQNQALNALVFLYKHVLKQPLNEKINAERAAKKGKIPVVLTRNETKRIKIAGKAQSLSLPYKKYQNRDKDYFLIKMAFHHFRDNFQAIGVLFIRWSSIQICLDDILIKG